MANSRSMVKAVIAVVVIAVAAYFIYTYGLRQPPGALPSKTEFICTECRHRFEIGTDDTTRLQDENPKNNGMIKCPMCEKFSARQGIRCKFCDGTYLPQESLEKYGEKYRCTQCGKRLGEE
jgi:DNA-directed RNA polymerase subunit RPC12/RpoP